jgi:transcriptional regulator with XRE-family HTH domain
MKKSEKEHLGKKIKRIRSFKSITQNQLAEMIGKTRSLVSFLERTGEVNKYTLQEIAVALNTTIEEIENLESVKENKATPNLDTSITNKDALIVHLKEENKFLKETIANQLTLLKELSKGKQKLSKR